MTSERLLDGLEIMMCMTLETANGSSHGNTWLAQQIREKTGRNFTARQIGRCARYLVEKGVLTRTAGPRGPALWALTTEGRRELRELIESFRRIEPF